MARGGTPAIPSPSHSGEAPPMMAAGQEPGAGAGWGPGMMAWGGGYGPGPWMMRGPWMGSPSGYGPGPWMMGAGWSGPGSMGWGGAYGPGPWMTRGPWMGPAMMGWGGYGACGGPGQAAQQASLDLTTAQVQATMDRWLALNGNPHVKLGNVTAMNADTITADIVTTDKGGLVQRFEINRHTGFVHPTGE